MINVNAGELLFIKFSFVKICNVLVRCENSFLICLKQLSCCEERCFFVNKHLILIQHDIAFITQIHDKINVDTVKEL